MEQIKSYRTSLDREKNLEPVLYSLSTHKWLRNAIAGQLGSDSAPPAAKEIKQILRDCIKTAHDDLNLRKGAFSTVQEDFVGLSTAFRGYLNNSMQGKYTTSPLHRLITRIREEQAKAKRQDRDVANAQDANRTIAAERAATLEKTISCRTHQRQTSDFVAPVARPG